MFKCITPFHIEDFTPQGPGEAHLLDIDNPDLGRRRDLCEGFLPLETGSGIIDTASNGLYSEFRIIKADVARSQVQALVSSRISQLSKPPSTTERRQITDGCARELAKSAALKSTTIPVLTLPAARLLLVGSKKADEARKIASAWLKNFVGGSIGIFPTLESILPLWATGKWLPTNAGLGESATLILTDGSETQLKGSQVSGGFLEDWLGQCLAVTRLALRFHEGWEWVMTPSFSVERFRRLGGGKKAIEDLKQQNPRDHWIRAERDYHSSLQWQSWYEMLAALQRFHNRPELARMKT